MSSRGPAAPERQPSAPSAVRGAGPGRGSCPFQARGAEPALLPPPGRVGSAGGEGAGPTDSPSRLSLQGCAHLPNGRPRPVPAGRPRPPPPPPLPGRSPHPPPAPPLAPPPAPHPPRPLGVKAAWATGVTWGDPAHPGAGPRGAPPRRADGALGPGQQAPPCEAALPPWPPASWPAFPARQSSWAARRLLGALIPRQALGLSGPGTAAAPGALGCCTRKELSPQWTERRPKD